MAKEINRRLRWIRRGFTFLFLVTVGFILLFPFLLNSSFAKNTLTQNLKQRTGVDWEIDALKYQDGIVSMEGLSAKLDTTSGVFRVRSIKIDPRWKSLFRRKVELDQIVVDEPKIILTEKIFSEITQRFKSSRSFATVETPQIKQQQKPKKTPLSEKPNQQEGTKQPVFKEQRPKQNPGPLVKQKPKLPAWLHVRRGQFTLMKELSNEELFSIEKMQAKIPIDGEGLQGSLEWGDCSIYKKPILSSGKAPVLLQNNKWTSGLTSTSLGLDYSVKLEVGRNRLLPFALQFQIPEQGLSFQLAEKHILAEAQSVQALAQLSGYAIRPFSWKGIVNLNGRELNLKEDLLDTELVFDRYGASLQLAGGILYSPTVFFVGEEVSFLGNGQLNARGQVAAVGRIIANDRIKGWLMKFSQGAVLTRGWGAAHSWMQPMPECPARWYRDIHIQSNEQAWWIDTGPKHAWVPMSLFLRMVKGFRDREIREEERKNSQNVTERGD